MHPRLSLENNPGCVEQIEALQRCHEDNSYIAKMLGACNDPKGLLAQCFRAEKKARVAPACVLAVGGDPSPACPPARAEEGQGPRREGERGAREIGRAHV